MLVGRREFQVMALASVAVVSPLIAQQPGDSGRLSSGAITCEGVVRLIDEPVLAASEAGLLIEVASEGDTVHKEQLVAKTDDSDARLAQEVALWAYRRGRKKSNRTSACGTRASRRMPVRPPTIMPVRPTHEFAGQFPPPSCDNENSSGKPPSCPSKTRNTNSKLPS